MKDIVISTDGDCPYCKCQKIVGCGNCSSPINTQIKKLCLPEKRIVLGSYLWGLIKFRCKLPGRHFHIKCNTESVPCYGRHKDNRKCSTAIGGCYEIIMIGCGGVWIDPVDEKLTTLDIEQFVKLVKSEGRLQNLLK